MAKTKSNKKNYK